MIAIDNRRHGADDSVRVENDGINRLVPNDREIFAKIFIRFVELH